ncbi:MAG: tungstate transporter permease [Actinobacteria bacterium HGW-Actinobacteria-10]|nr:MAG: tungstate transporter permease [Actinobacteria bacterium HGW-Actinobacteria-10]
MQIYTDAIVQGWQLLASGTLDVWSIVLASLRVSGMATSIALLLGIPAGYLLGTARSVSRHVALVFANTGMGMPPVAVGLIVAMTLSRRGPLGDMGLLYSQTAMVIAQLVIATPVIMAVTAASVSGVPRELRLQARSLGASRFHEMALTLREARMGLFAAVAAGFGAIISEVGASQMLGGNLEGETRVMTTAMVQFTRMGRYGPALALGVILVGIVLAVNILLTTVQTSGERYEGGRR